MNILSLTTIYPNERIDAEGRSVRFLDQALAKLGVGGTTLVLKPWAPLWLAGHLPQWKHLAVRPRIEESDGLRVVFSHYIHIPVRYRLDLCVKGMAYQAIRLVRKYGWKFDLIHGECVHPASLAARLVSQHFRVPFIITLRDDLGHLKDLYQRRGAKELFASMFDSVSAIFLIGPALMRDIPDFLSSEAQAGVHLVPNGVDFDGLESVLQNLPQPPAHSFGHIVSVGNLYRFKGIHENLQALRILDERGFRDWHYTVVGDGPYRRELEALAQRNGLGERVEFVGKVPHAEAIRQIRDADIFCLPSWAEAFGNVYGEAAVCARPAIGCQGCGAELTIQDGETGFLVPPRDVRAIADVLSFLLTHPEAARKMGEEGGRHIRQFTWERTAQIYRQAINQIILRPIDPPRSAGG